VPTAFALARNRGNTFRMENLNRYNISNTLLPGQF
jgi:hypothetical protein